MYILFMKMMSHNLEKFRSHFKEQYMGLLLDDFKKNLETNWAIWQPFVSQFGIYHPRLSSLIVTYSSYWLIIGAPKVQKERNEHSIYNNGNTKQFTKKAGIFFISYNPYHILAIGEFKSKCSINGLICLI